jgi:hypothetical protein
VKVTAEAELLAAVVTFFERVGLTSNDVVIKVNSRKVKQTKLSWKQRRSQTNLNRITKLKQSFDLIIS